MVISYQWVLNYLPQPLPLTELTDILTSIGLEVEATEPAEVVKGSLEGLVIGEVLTCEQHPNADKLKLTTVNIGGDTDLKIVCGAPNVAAGQKVVVAPVGTTVHPMEGEPFLIKKAKIRGEESQGMICAEDEISLGHSHDGIMILPEDAPVGKSAKDYFNIPAADFAIHIGLTPNRTDAMSHIGVARDVCAYLSHHRQEHFSVQMPETPPIGTGTPAAISVSVSATEACPRYAGIMISNVAVGASPEWLKQRLATIGVRSINNVVDVTNFVLHEFGQPLHAFDAAKIKGQQVQVRFPDEGTTFLALDEKERKLAADDLLICDAQDGMCIAGVFGGLQSGVSDITTSVFLESAYFHPTYIRRTSMRHGLRTDAATHFEKGVDINNVLPALQRAAALICEVSGGTIASDIVDVYPQKMDQVTVTVSFDYIHKLTGKQYEKSAVRNILSALGFELIQETEKLLTVKVPTNKVDVTQPADIVEEILRIDGLDNVPIPERLNVSLLPAKPTDRPLREKVAETLCSSGMQEIVTNSIVNSKYYPERSDLVRMLNNLSSELDVMRPAMLESGLEVIQYNCNRKNNDLCLFEFGTVYTKPGEQYDEQQQLAIWATGNVAAAHWDQQPKPVDVFYLKGMVAKLMARCGISQVVEATNGLDVSYSYKKRTLCTIASVPAATLQVFDIRQGVYFVSIDWALWCKAAAASVIRFAEVPRFPAVQRDLAIVLDKAVTYRQVAEATKQLKLSALIDFDLFDIYEGEKLGADKKSFALSYTFQLNDRTLTDTEIDQLMRQLMSAYTTKLQARIRE